MMIRIVRPLSLLTASLLIAAMATGCAPADSQQHIVLLSDTRCELVLYPGDTEKRVPASCVVKAGLPTILVPEGCGQVSLALVSGVSKTLVLEPGVAAQPSTCALPVTNDLQTFALVDSRK